MKIEPFYIPYSEADVLDLRDRLRRTRWPDEIAGAMWEYGTNLSYMKEICQYWKDEFDWKKQIEKLSAFCHYRYKSRDLGIHFIRVTGKGPKPMPLILTHGWPGSFLEMEKVVPLLTDPTSSGGDPRDAFDVIVPSLPGYGFSDRPSERGMNIFRIADIWAELMRELGYNRFGAHGGDWGAYVTTLLALRHPEMVIGIHLNYIPPYKAFLNDGAALSDSERAAMADADRWDYENGAYDHVQKREPQTLSFGLTDSPAALAAWMVSKFRDWSDCNGNIERIFTKDELLTNITLYWMTQTAHSSCRLYYEDERMPLQFRKGDYVKVPTGVAHFPKEAPFVPRSWVERGYNVQRWTEMPRGGHFAAMEEPGLLVEDLRSFFRVLRDQSLGELNHGN